MCVSGTRWVRDNILNKYHEEELVVYAIWFNMIPSDRKDRWDRNLLADRRVRHYWDDERILGRWMTEHVDSCQHLGEIDWDSYYFFDGSAVWADSLEDIQACGTPIIRTTESLAEAASAVLQSNE